jgi:succinate dehydrogenase flavin-adding protein (antitoxin of CptAB toxin-antitoxin module)
MTSRRHSFEQWCFRQHDVVCNQKYDNQHPYSFHLKIALGNFDKFKYLLDKKDWEIVECGVAGHDLIEDARITYNEIINTWPTDFGVEVANIIYACTEEKGKDRDERHNEKYYQELSENKLAIFVKLCDIAANVTYSVLTHSSMGKRYKKEWSKNLNYLYVDEYKPLIDHISRLLLTIHEEEVAFQGAVK